MTLTYEWAITGIKKMNDPSVELNDIIVQTYWTCTGTNEQGNAGTFTGATPFEPDKVDPENFTEYSQLTEAQVIGWIQDLVTNDEGYWNHIEQVINKQIVESTRAVEIVDNAALPWASVPSSNI